MSTSTKLLTAIQPCLKHESMVIQIFYDKRYRGHVSTKTVDAQFISHYAFQSGNRSSSGEILQTHKDKAAPFGKTKIVSGFLMVFSNCFH